MTYHSQLLSPGYRSLSFACDKELPSVEALAAAATLTCGMSMRLGADPSSAVVCEKIEYPGTLNRALVGEQ